MHHGLDVPVAEFGGLLHAPGEALVGAADEFHVHRDAIACHALSSFAASAPVVRLPYLTSPCWPAPQRAFPGASSATRRHVRVHSTRSYGERYLDGGTDGAAGAS